MGSNKIKNILFFFGDQHRADCLGCYGNDIVQTPTMDSLAANGVRFTNTFSPAPTCTPARACVQTGQLAHEHKIIFNPEFQDLNGGALELKKDAPLFAPMLKDKGYQLAHIGKWHVGHHSGNSTSRPVDCGYDEGVYYKGYGWPSGPVVSEHYMEYLKGLGLDGFNITEPIGSKTGKSTYAGVQEGPMEASVPYYLASQTIDKIKEFSKNDKPFFVECHFWGPHSPYWLPESVYRRYEGEDIPVWPNFKTDLANKPDAVRTWGKRWGIHAMDAPTLSRLIGLYYAYITHIDEVMGMVIDELKKCGHLEDTLIVYSADHGASVGSHTMWDKGYGLFDCLVKVPMILSHPSFQPSVNDSNVDLLDLPVTFLDAAGLARDERMRGGSLLPIARREETSIHGETQIVEHFGHTVPFAERMARNRKYKYVCNSTDTDEFYDIESDPHEISNIIDKADPKALRSLKADLRDWMQETGDKYGLRFMAEKLK